MSRKDCEAIAAVVARHAYELNDAGVALVSELADYLQADNERFDRDRFIDACIPSELPTTRALARSRSHLALLRNYEGALIQRQGGR